MLLALHFVFNLSVVILAWFRIVLRNPNFAMASLETMAQEVVLAGWCLAGLPLILLAAWGVLQRRETLVRLYMAYLFGCVVSDLVYFLRTFILSQPCEHVSEILSNVAGGEAFACGVARFYSGVTTVLCVGIQMYLLHVVWSLCEDLAEGGGSDISDLMIDSLGRPASSEMMRKKKLNQDIGEVGGHGGYSSLLGLNGGPESIEGGGFISEVTSTLGLTAPPLGGAAQGAYESCAASGLGGGSRMFGGTYHELQYPPPYRHAR